jgi:hypothetical protein
MSFRTRNGYFFTGARGVLGKGLSLTDSTTLASLFTGLGLNLGFEGSVAVFKFYVCWFRLENS